MGIVARLKALDDRVFPQYPQPPWWNVFVYGALVPGAVPRWRRQRIVIGLWTFGFWLVVGLLVAALTL